MAIIVQKFGGTSVNTVEKREKVLDKIIAAKEKGYDVVVVVSAMGRKGEPYATDTFLDMLNEIGPAAAPRTKDLLASCGETISVCLVAHALEQRGYKACPMTGFQAGILTDPNFTNADISDINPQKVQKALLDGYIVVAAGFQGVTADLDITTLGRGGSDTTAIALGGALGAELVEIYTDVPGVAFTDPRLIPEAPYVKSIDFYPLHMLARAGAKVVHHRAVKTAIAYNMPFFVRSTFSDDEGTLIGKCGESFGGFYGMALLKGVRVLKVEGPDHDGFWKKWAVDEIYYQDGLKECILVVQAPAGLSGIRQESSFLSEECDLLTIMWDSTCGVTRETVEQVLVQKGINPLGFFNLTSGGGWAVPADRSTEAIRAVYDLANGFPQAV